MKTQIVFMEQDFEDVRRHLLAGPDEAAALLICGYALTGSRVRLLVRETVAVPAEGIESKGGAFITLRPEWLAVPLKQAREAGLTIVLTHSHPFSRGTVRFSSIDTAGQAALVPKMKARLPSRPVAELVFGQDSIDGLLWLPGARKPLPLGEVAVVGSRLDVQRCSNVSPMTFSSIEAMYDRQVLVWGPEGQARLKAFRVGVVGVGGNGSWVAAQLIHLGVGELVVIDDDVIEESNRARVVGSEPADVVAATPKVDVAARYAARHDPHCRVIPIQESVNSDAAIQALLECDLVVGCTDTLAGRVIPNQLAVQYFVPFLDTGVEIEVVGGCLRSIAARCTLVRPGSPCLVCMGYLSDEGVSHELGAASRPGYLEAVRAPSVGPLNALAASMAGTDFLRFVHGLLGGVPTDSFSAYSGRSGEIRRCSVGSKACPLCSHRLGYGQAAELELPSKAPTLPDSVFPASAES
jgi:molybdopterin/thiamine biosynthesis adenylyltransferase